VNSEWEYFVKEKGRGNKPGNIVTVLYPPMTVRELPTSLQQGQTISCQQLPALLPMVAKPSANAASANAASADQPSADAAELPPLSKRPRVFISYSTQNRPFVEHRLFPMLGEAGFAAWFSVDGIRAADEWERKIFEALNSSDLFVVVMSPGAVASDWVRTEVQYATQYLIGRIVPLLLVPCSAWEIHLKLGPLQHVDFTTDSAEAARRLVLTLRQLFEIHGARR
jgi:hypothetical protein